MTRDRAEFVRNIGLLLCPPILEMVEGWPEGTFFSWAAWASAPDEVRDQMDREASDFEDLEAAPGRQETSTGRLALSEDEQVWRDEEDWEEEPD